MEGAAPVTVCLAPFKSQLVVGVAGDPRDPQGGQAAPPGPVPRDGLRGERDRVRGGQGGAGGGRGGGQVPAVPAPPGAPLLPPARGVVHLRAVPGPAPHPRLQHIEHRGARLPGGERQLLQPDQGLQRGGGPRHQTR